MLALIYTATKSLNLLWYHSIATLHLLANFPQVKCLRDQVTSESKQDWQLDLWEMTSAWYGETISSTPASNEWQAVY